MIRDPSLHITRSSLCEILGKMLTNCNPVEVEQVVDKIFELAQPHQIRDRYMQVADMKAATKKKVSRSVLADAELPFGVLEAFNRILVACLQKQNSSRRVTLISKDSKDYLMLKEIAALACGFATDFEIKPIETGLKEYVALGLKLMPKYALNKFKFYDKKIHEAYECYVDLSTDKDPEGTDRFYDEYKIALAMRAGLHDHSDNDYTKYVHFMYGRQAADKAGANYADWVKSQFDGLEFMNVVPEPNQLYGENALKRYDRSLKVLAPKPDETNIDLTTIYDEDKKFTV